MAIRVWDILFWVTAIFPFFTGGVWIQRPGLFLELSEITVPLLILTLWGWILIRFFKVSLDQATSIRFCKRLWRFWTESLKRKPLRTLWIGAGVFGTLWSFILVRKHHNFQTSPGDLAVFVNSIWNLANGYGYQSSVKNGLSLFCDHQYITFGLFGPVFSVFPFPETLLVAQGFIMATGAVGLFLIGRQYLPLNNPYQAILPLLYWGFNPVRNAVRFDGHPEIILLPLFLFSIWGIQSQKMKDRILGVFFLILGLMCKESAGPVVAGLGLGWSLGAGPKNTKKFTKSVGVISILVGSACFYLGTYALPKFFGCSYAYQGNYSQFGKNLSDVLLAPFLQPTLFFSHVFGLSRLRFLFFTLFPLAFLPLLNWKIFLGAIPAYLIFFLTEGNHRVNPEYYYAIEASVALLWAMPGAALMADKFFPIWKERFPLVLGLCAALALGRSDLFYLRFFNPDSHKQWLRQSFIPRINPSSSLSASGLMVSHLATRHWAHFLPVIRMPQGGLVDCIIYDPWIGNWPLDAEQGAEIRNGKLTQAYDLIYQFEELRVWQRKGANPCFSY
jgi:uncharacterized membrane protein